MSLIALVLLFLSLAAPASAIDRLIGGAVLGPEEVLGACKASFTMTDGGVALLLDEATQQQIVTAPFESGNAGNLYVTTRTAATGTNLYQIPIPTFIVPAPSSITVAASPDDPGSLNGSHYNTNNGNFVSVGRQLIAGCVNCVHFREYLQSALGTNVTPGPLSNSGTGPLAVLDGTFTYVQYDTVGGGLIGKFATGSYIPLSIGTVQGGVSATGYDIDNTFLYASVGALQIQRFMVSSLATASVGFTPGFAGGTALGPPTVDGNFFYIASRSAGASANFLYKVSTSTMTIVGTLTFGNQEFTDRVFVDPINEKLYLTIRSGGTQATVVRIGRQSFTVEQTFNGTSTLDGPTLYQSAIDTIHQGLYTILGGGGGTVSRIQKVNLCT